MQTDPNSETDHISDGRDSREQLRRYGLGVLAAIVALGLRELLTPLLGENNPYHTVWAAVVFSAWYCGLWPSILTAVLSLFGVWYWFLPPPHSFALDEPRTAISGMLGFLVFSSLIIALGESNRRSLAGSQWAEEQLRKAHDGLERKVQERTADLNLANENLRELSGRLQQMRDEERRQISRELHDSVGQLLAALSMNLGVVMNQSHKLDAAGVRAVSENAAMVEQISSEIRTISHLLHPPCLTRLVLHLPFAGMWTAFQNAAKSRSMSIFRMTSDGSRMKWKSQSSGWSRNASPIFIATPEAPARPYACVRKITALRLKSRTRAKAYLSKNNWRSYPQSAPGWGFAACGNV